MIYPDFTRGKKQKTKGQKDEETWPRSQICKVGLQNSSIWLQKSITSSNSNNIDKSFANSEAP